MRLWQLYAALALAIAATLGTFTVIASPAAHVKGACRAPVNQFELDACAALGR